MNELTLFSLRNKKPDPQIVFFKHSDRIDVLTSLKKTLEKLSCGGTATLTLTTRALKIITSNDIFAEKITEIYTTRCAQGKTRTFNIPHAELNNFTQQVLEVPFQHATEEANPENPPPVVPSHAAAGATSAPAASAASNYAAATSNYAAAVAAHAKTTSDLAKAALDLVAPESDLAKAASRRAAAASDLAQETSKLAESAAALAAADSDHIAYEMPPTAPELQSE